MNAGQALRLLFFTGGTALRGLSRRLAGTSTQSVHIVTTFDAGGSTATLRKAFAMPAVGDIRNRLLALADESVVPQTVFTLMQHRLPADCATEPADAAQLRQELDALALGRHPLWQGIAPDFATPLRELVRECVERLPAHFDPRGACVGNLAICGGYLRHKRDFDPVLALLGQLLRVRGRVVPVVDESLHLACELADGSLVVGQHHFKHLPAPICRLMLTVHDPNRATPSLSDATPCRPRLSETARRHIAAAGAICYPMGSFYSSLLANLLPRGVGHAIAANPCPKIFIPNSGTDPEVSGLSLAGQVALLLDTLRADAPAAQDSDFLHAVLIDSRNGRYDMDGTTKDVLRARGITLIDRPMVMPGNPACHEPAATLAALRDALSP